MPLYRCLTLARADADPISELPVRVATAISGVYKLKNTDLNINNRLVAINSEAKSPPPAPVYPGAEIL